MSPGPDATINLGKSSAAASSLETNPLTGVNQSIAKGTEIRSNSGDAFVVDNLLGQGGMAEVYRVNLLGASHLGIVAKTPIIDPIGNVTLVDRESTKSLLVDLGIVRDTSTGQVPQVSGFNPMTGNPKTLADLANLEYSVVTFRTMLESISPELSNVFEVIVINNRQEIDRLKANPDNCFDYLAAQINKSNIPTQLATTRNERTRAIQREYAMLKELQGSSICPRVYDMGIAPDQRQVVFEEFIDGVDLESVLSLYVQSDPKTRVNQSLEIFKGLLNAQLTLSIHGIAHGDIKPRNVHILADGRVVLLDFGKAIKDVGTIALQSLSRMTGANAHGSYGYTAPESVYHARQSGDLYSICMIAVEAVTGENPVAVLNKLGTKGNDWAALYHHYEGLLTKMVANGEASSEIAALLLRGISPQQIERTANAHQILTELEKIQVSTSQPSQPKASPPAPQPNLTPASWGMAPTQKVESPATIVNGWISNIATEKDVGSVMTAITNIAEDLLNYVKKENFAYRQMDEAMTQFINLLKFTWNLKSGDMDEVFGSVQSGISLLLTQYVKNHPGDLTDDFTRLFGKARNAVVIGHKEERHDYNKPMLDYLRKNNSNTLILGLPLLLADLSDIKPHDKKIYSAWINLADTYVKAQNNNFTQGKNGNTAYGTLVGRLGVRVAEVRSHQLGSTFLPTADELDEVIACAMRFLPDLVTPTGSIDSASVATKNMFKLIENIRLSSALFRGSSFRDISNQMKVYIMDNWGREYPENVSGFMGIGGGKQTVYGAFKNLYDNLSTLAGLYRGRPV